MRKVIIATPAHDGRCDAEYTYALAETIRLGTQTGYDIRILILPGEALIQKARSELVMDALQYGFDDLIFIDSDQSWKPEWVLRLLHHPVDCVGGAVRKKSDEEAYNVRVAGAKIQMDQTLKLLIVDGLGTGFLRLSKAALQALWDRSEPYMDDYGKACRLVFEVRVDNGRLVSEDIGMASKLAAAGIKIYLDPVITCDHIGRKKYSGNFLRYLRALNDDKTGAHHETN